MVDGTIINKNINKRKQTKLPPKNTLSENFPCHLPFYSTPVTATLWLLCKSLF